MLRGSSCKDNFWHHVVAVVHIRLKSLAVVVCFLYGISCYACSYTYSTHTCFLQMLVTYGQYILQTGAVGNPYGEKYKGIWLSLTILSRALAGNYVNFGVFDLYGDPALKVCDKA